MATQAEVDAARATMFSTFDARRGSSAALTAAQNANQASYQAWVTACNNFSNLSNQPTATPEQVEAAKQAVIDTEAARWTAWQNLLAVQASVAGAPAAFEAALAAYKAACNSLYT